jgi:hypothetical protein
VIWIKLERKRRRKGQGFGCSGVKSCNLTRSQIAAIVEGGNALFGGQIVGTATTRVTRLSGDHGGVAPPLFLERGNFVGGCWYFIMHIENFASASILLCFYPGVFQSIIFIHRKTMVKETDNSPSCIY